MKNQRVFIDTNIYLDFYRPSEHSTDTLVSLIRLIKKKEIELILPKQVISEFVRDKEIVFAEFIKQNLQHIKDPGFIDKNKVKRLNKSLDLIKEDYKKKFFSPRSNINVSIKELFELAVIPGETSELLDLAYYRTLRRNPPRKDNNSFGDAIIWETLIENFSDRDIVIVSRDGDFSSEIEKNTIHPFLREEWSHSRSKKVVLSDSLGELINRITKKETVKVEAIQEEKKFGEYYTAHTNGARLNMVNASGLVNNLGTNFIISSQPIFGSDIMNPTRASLLGERTCECCGKKLESYSAHNRCYDCLTKVPVTCEKCGRRFFSNSMTITGRYVCSECSGVSDYQISSI